MNTKLEFSELVRIKVIQYRHKIINRTGTLLTCFPDTWSTEKVKTVIMTAYRATGGKGGQVAIRDLLPENIPNVYVNVVVKGNKIITA